MRRSHFLAPLAGAVLLGAALAWPPASSGAQEPTGTASLGRGITLLADHQFAIRIASDRRVRDLDERYVLTVEPSSDLDAAGFAAAGTLVERGEPVEAWLTVDGADAYPFVEARDGRLEWTYPGSGFLAPGPEYRIRVLFRTSTGEQSLETGFPHPG